MSLPTLVAQEKWQEFDDAWTELLANDGPIDELLHALHIVSAKKRMPRCLPMVRDHAERLSENGRPADAARLLGSALDGGGAVSEIADALYENAQKAWGSEPYWDRFTEAGIDIPLRHEDVLITPGSTLKVEMVKAAKDEDA